jgi:hypothetical protein
MMQGNKDAILEIIPGANPGWRIAGGEGQVVFNWGRPRGAAHPFSLRFYWTCENDSEIQWAVRWRWTQAIAPGTGPNPPLTSLGPDLSLPASIRTKTFGRQPGADNQLAFQLHVSEPIQLKSALDGGEYLQVEIRLPDSRTAGRVYLLLAELMWEAG